MEGMVWAVIKAFDESNEYGQLFSWSFLLRTISLFLFV